MVCHSDSVLSSVADHVLSVNVVPKLNIVCLYPWWWWCIPSRKSCDNVEREGRTILMYMTVVLRKLCSPRRNVYYADVPLLYAAHGWIHILLMMVSVYARNAIIRLCCKNQFAYLLPGVDLLYSHQKKMGQSMLTMKFSFASFSFRHDTPVVPCYHRRCCRVCVGPCGTF